MILTILRATAVALLLGQLRLVNTAAGFALGVSKKGRMVLQHG